MSNGSDNSIKEYNHENKINIKTLEDTDEIFVDKLEDIGVFNLSLNDSISFGTYKNVFKCENFSIKKEDDLNIESRIIKAFFYENEEEIYIKVLTTIDNEGSVLDLEIFWFDSEGNDVPSSNSNWSSIIENMDIFLDDDE